MNYEQVIDVLFNAHDNRASSIAAEIQKVERELAAAEAQLDTIVAFLTEQEIPERENLTGHVQALNAEIAASEASLAEIEGSMAAVTHFGDHQRQAHVQASASANEAANRLREARTQIERLTALAAQRPGRQRAHIRQRSELAVRSTADRRVPVVRSAGLDPRNTRRACSVCHQRLTDATTADTSVDLSRELRAIKRRQSELADLLDELHGEAREAEATVAASAQLARDSQAALDRAMRSRFAPFIDQRYQHFLDWAASPTGQTTQLIVVDNLPPQVADDVVHVRYTADADSPPYGLIDDATT